MSRRSAHASPPRPPRRSPERNVRASDARSAPRAHAHGSRRARRDRDARTSRRRSGHRTRRPIPGSVPQRSHVVREEAAPTTSTPSSASGASARPNAASTAGSRPGARAGAPARWHPDTSRGVERTRRDPARAGARLHAGSKRLRGALGRVPRARARRERDNRSGSSARGNRRSRRRAARVSIAPRVAGRPSQCAERMGIGLWPRRRRAHVAGSPIHAASSSSGRRAVRERHMIGIAADFFDASGLA